MVLPKHFILSAMIIPTFLCCRPDVSGFRGADVEAKQLQDDSGAKVLVTVKPAAALAFQTVSLAPLPTFPSLSDLFKLPQSPQPISIDNSLQEITTPLPSLMTFIPTRLIPLVSNTFINDVNGNDVMEGDKTNDANREDTNSSGNGTNNEEDTTTTSSTASPTTTTEITTTSTELPKEECTRATVTAITLMPYNDQLVMVDIERIKQQIILLESYTQTKFESFGSFSQEAINVDGQFALEYRIQNVRSCADLRDYATKAVSYSREIERILFTCHCEPMWIIAKRRSG